MEPCTASGTSTISTRRRRMQSIGSHHPRPLLAFGLQPYSGTVKRIGTKLWSAIRSIKGTRRTMESRADRRCVAGTLLYGDRARHSTPTVDKAEIGEGAGGREGVLVGRGGN